MFRYSLIELWKLFWQMLPGIVVFLLLFAAGTLQNSIEILIYRGICLAAIAFVIQFTLLYSFSFLHKKSARYEDIARWVSAASIALSINLIFLVIVPVTIDRSVSVYLLDRLANHEEGLSKSELETLLTEEFVKKYDAVGRRMNEQIDSGNVIEKNGRFSISRQGELFLDFGRNTAKLFGVDPRLISERKRHDPQ